MRTWIASLENSGESKTNSLIWPPLRVSEKRNATANGLSIESIFKMLA